MIRDTSLEAYDEMKPMIGISRRAVYEAIMTGGPVTNSEIARTLGWSINRVTPRVLELRAMGLVEDSGTRPCTVTGRRCHAWRPRMEPIARQLEFA